MRGANDFTRVASHGDVLRLEAFPGLGWFRDGVAVACPPPFRLRVSIADADFIGGVVEEPDHVLNDMHAVLKRAGGAETECFFYAGMDAAHVSYARAPLAVVSGRVVGFVDLARR